MFKRAGVTVAGTGFVERELQLREARTAHHWCDIDDGDRIFPAGQNARHKAIRRDERVIAFDDGARDTQFRVHTGLINCPRCVPVILPSLKIVCPRRMV